MVVAEGVETGEASVVHLGGVINTRAVCSKSRH